MKHGDELESREKKQRGLELNGKERKRRGELPKISFASVGDDLRSPPLTRRRTSMTNMADRAATSSTTSETSYQQYQANEARQYIPQDLKSSQSKLQPIIGESAGFGLYPGKTSGEPKQPGRLKSRSKISKLSGMPRSSYKGKDLPSKEIAHDVAKELKLHYLRSIFHQEPEILETDWTENLKNVTTDARKVVRNHNSAIKFLFGDNTEGKYFHSNG